MPQPSLPKRLTSTLQGSKLSQTNKGPLGVRIAHLQKSSSRHQDPRRQTRAYCNDVSTMGTVRWCIHRAECGKQNHPTGKTYLAHSGCQVLVLSLSMTPVLHFTNCVHHHSTPLAQPTPKSEYHSEIVAKRESVSHCSSEFKKKGFIKEQKCWEKTRTVLKSTFLFVYDPIVHFCFQNRSLIIR